VQFSEVSVVQFSSVSVSQFSSASVMQFSLVSVMPFSLVSVARFSLVSFGRGAAIGRARPPGCSTRIHRSASKYPHSSHVSKSRRGTRHGYRWPCRAVQGRAGPCRAVQGRAPSPVIPTRCTGRLSPLYLSTSLPLHLFDDAKAGRHLLGQLHVGYEVVGWG
jgi:hypothetical protein